MLKINWEALSAIGQISSSVIAAAAIIISLYQRKPKLIIKSNIEGKRYSRKLALNDITIYITSFREYPFQIDEIGVEFPQRLDKNYKLEVENLPKIIRQGEVYKVSVKLEAPITLGKGNRGFLGRSNIYVIDGFGNLYREKKWGLINRVFGLYINSINGR